MAGRGHRVNYNCWSSERLNIALLSLYLFPLSLPFIQQLLLLVHTSSNIININWNVDITLINSDNKSHTDSFAEVFFLHPFYEPRFWWEHFHACFWSLSKGKQLRYWQKKNQFHAAFFLWVSCKQIEITNVFWSEKQFHCKCPWGGNKTVKIIWNLDRVLNLVAAQSSWTLNSH